MRYQAVRTLRGGTETNASYEYVSDPLWALKSLLDEMDEVSPALILVS